MFNVRTAPVSVSGLMTYPDASGAPAVVSIGPFVYAANFIGGEVRIALISRGSGSRVESKIAADRARRAYSADLEKITDAAWRAASVALYA